MHTRTCDQIICGTYLQTPSLLISNLFLPPARNRTVDIVVATFYKCSAVAEMGDCLATIDMGRKMGAVPLLGGDAGSPCNTIWPGPRPTFIPSGILIHPPFGHSTPTSQTGQRDRTERQDNGPTEYGEPFLGDRLKNG